MNLYSNFANTFETSKIQKTLEICFLLLSNTLKVEVIFEKSISICAKNTRKRLILKIKIIK